jgi:hypothetical protein
MRMRRRLRLEIHSHGALWPLKLETSCNNCSADFDARCIPPVTAATAVRMLGSRRWENDEFFSARAMEPSLLYSVHGVFSHRRKAAFPLTHDIEADESLRTAFSQFRSNDEA